MKTMKKLISSILMLSSVGKSVGVAGLGIAAKKFQPQVVDGYQTVVDSVKNETIPKAFDSVKESVDKISTNFPEYADEINKYIDSLNETLINLNEEITKIESSLISSGTSDTDPLMKLLKTLKESQVSTQKSLEIIQSQLKNTTDFINGQLDKNDAESLYSQINNTINQLEKTYDSFSKQINLLPTDSFSKAYGLIADLLIIIPSVILGLGIISWITTKIFYKNVDGKLVRSVGAKKELTKHVKKIIKKYPDIKEEIDKK